MDLHPSFIHSAEQDTSGRRNVQAFIDAMCIEKSKTCRQIAMGDLNACRLCGMRSCLMRCLHECHFDKKTSSPLSGQTLSSKSDPAPMGSMVQMRQVIVGKQHVPRGRKHKFRERRISDAQVQFNGSFCGRLKHLPHRCRNRAAT